MGKSKQNSLLLGILLMGMLTQVQAQNYPQHSVLSSGTWYKITIAEEGIYKIGCTELSALEGKSIHGVGMYGNGGGMLPDANAIERINDLRQNPIKIVDHNGNGVFENGDYLLFYATSANTWTYSAEESIFKYNVHATATTIIILFIFFKYAITHISRSISTFFSCFTSINFTLFIKPAQRAKTITPLIAVYRFTNPINNASIRFNCFHILKSTLSLHNYKKQRTHGSSYRLLQSI